MSMDKDQAQGRIAAATRKEQKSGLAVVTRMLADDTQGDSSMRRDAHPKHRGCVAAFVRIDSSSLPRSHDICGVETASLCRAPKH